MSFFSARRTAVRSVLPGMSGASGFWPELAIRHGQPAGAGTGAGSGRIAGSGQGPGASLVLGGALRVVVRRALGGGMGPVSGPCRQVTEDRMTESELELREQLVRYARQMLAAGLVRGTSGNISARPPGEDWCLLTPSGVDY